MTLLLIPGFMADATLWDAMTKDLAPFGPLVATDLGQGEDIETMAAAILGDAPASFVAVGFSMGGYVARELARIAPDRVSALILIATSARGDTEELIRQRRSALKAAPRAFKGLSRPAIVSSLHPDLATDEAMIARIRDMGLRLGGEVFHRQSAMARSGDLDRLDRDSAADPDRNGGRRPAARSGRGRRTASRGRRFDAGSHCTQRPHDPAGTTAGPGARHVWLVRRALSLFASDSRQPRLCGAAQIGEVHRGEKPPALEGGGLRGHSRWL